MNADRYEADWKFDTDRRLAKLENADAGVRIAALEKRWVTLDDAAHVYEFETEGRLKAFSQRIAALENLFKHDDDACLRIMDLNHFEERIAALEGILKRDEEADERIINNFERRISKLFDCENRLIDLYEEHGKRIAALEAKLK